jgi:two-component system sensor histidine kinase QseC
MKALRPAAIPSLRGRLLWAVGAVSLGIWAITGVLSYYQARREAEEFLDGHLALSARTLLAVARQDSGRVGERMAGLDALRRQPRGIYEPTLEFQIGRGDGSLLFRSGNAPALPLRGMSGFHDIERDGQAWRLYNLAPAEGDLRVQVAQAMDLRERAALEVAIQTILPVGAFLPLLLLLLYLSIRRGLKPLDELADEVSARTQDNLAALTNRTAPREAMPLVAAINRLLFRLGLTLENERRFTADAAHELRTPLAGVKTQAQVALLSRDEAAREHALRQLLAGADRACRLVDQLLRLARLDPLASLRDTRPVDLAEFAEATVAERLDDAIAGGHVLELQVEAGPLWVQGDADLLAVALRNLVDNALRHTPAGCRVTVRVEVAEGHAQLSVLDDGPGVPDAELPRLGQRFHRGPAARAEGSGLGLAIVRRIAELHGAILEFQLAPAGGLIVRMSWE